MELKIPIEIVFDDVNSVIDELGKLQKYKLCEGDDMTLVDVDDIVDVLTRHVMAREAKEPCGTKEGWNPCDWCKYNPPSSMDGKPCTICPAVGRGESE